MEKMQRYVSKELTHFVGRNLRKEGKGEITRREEQYQTLLKIIEEKYISYPPHYPNRKTLILRHRIVPMRKFSCNDMIVPSMICFCDIPIEDLGIHIRKYSHFGLSFQKSFLIERGANPVLYVERSSRFDGRTRAEYFDQNVELYLNVCNDIGCFETLLKSGSDSTEFTKRMELKPKECAKIDNFVLHLLSQIKFFNNNKPDDDKDNFYMEREWRSPYNIDFEEIANIYRIILPRSYSKRLRDDVPEYVGQVTFSDDFD